MATRDSEISISKNILKDILSKKFDCSPVDIKTINVGVMFSPISYLPEDERVAIVNQNVDDGESRKIMIDAILRERDSIVKSFSEKYSDILLQKISSESDLSFLLDDFISRNLPENPLVPDVRIRNSQTSKGRIAEIRFLNYHTFPNSERISNIAQNSEMIASIIAGVFLIPRIA
jgi:hypothetical protein